MFVLGLLLIVLSAGALVAVLASGTDDQAAMYGGSVHVPTLVIFLAGAAALLLFIMGLELVRSGLKRANRTRQNNKRLRKLEKREERRGDEGGRDQVPAGGGTAARTSTGAGAGTSAGPTRTDSQTDPHSGPGTSRDDNGPDESPPPAP